MTSFRSWFFDTVISQSYLSKIQIFDSRSSQILGHYSTPNNGWISNIFWIARRGRVIRRSLKMGAERNVYLWISALRQNVSICSHIFNHFMKGSPLHLKKTNTVKTEKHWLNIDLALSANISESEVFVSKARRVKTQTLTIWAKPSRVTQPITGAKKTLQLWN